MPINNYKENSAIIRFFDQCAQNSIMDEINIRELSLLRYFESFWNIRPGDKILEPGCGSGRFSDYLSGIFHNANIFSFDISSSMIRKAHLLRKNQNTLFFRSSVHYIPIVKYSMDKILLINAFPHFESKEKCLKIFRSLLKPEGRLFINHFENKDKLNQFHKNLPHPACNHMIPDDERMHDLLNESRFTDIILDSKNDYYMVCAKALTS